MFEKLAEDIYWATIQKLAALEKDAASNLRSDLVLGRLSDAAKNTLMSTPRYSKANPGQILADIRSSLRGKGNNVGALTSELTRRGIPYKVRGRGLSPKDIELDLSKGHDILNTTYLPSNYSESFIDNNVNRRFGKAVNNANKAGYKKVNVTEEYESPMVWDLPDNSNSIIGQYIKNDGPAIDMYIPAVRENKNNNQLQFDKRNAGSILHETNELNRIIQNKQHYNKIIKNDQNSHLYTSGKYPGIIQSPNTIHKNRSGRSKPSLSMFGGTDSVDMTPTGPYNTTGANNHESATILMNELMDEHALQVGVKPEPSSINDVFPYRKQGPNNPVNRMTGINLTSGEQPFVPRNIAKNKKEYLKRIRAVRKAEDALQRDYLTNTSYNSDSEKRYQLNKMLLGQHNLTRPDFSDYIDDILYKKQSKQYNDFLINYLRNRGIPVE